MVHKQLAPKYTHSYIDSCALSPPESEENCTRRLLNMYEDGEIVLMLPHTVKNEIGHPKTPGLVQQQAASLIFSNETGLTPDELSLREDIRTLVRGNAKPGAHQNDADHLYNNICS